MKFRESRGWSHFLRNGFSQVDPEARIISEAYPYVASRVLTDEPARAAGSPTTLGSYK